MKRKSCEACVNKILNQIEVKEQISMLHYLLLYYKIFNNISLLKSQKGLLRVLKFCKDSNPKQILGGGGCPLMSIWDLACADPVAKTPTV